MDKQTIKEINKKNDILRAEELKRNITEMKEGFGKIEMLNLPNQIYFPLKKAGINAITELTSMTDKDVLAINGISYTRLVMLINKLSEYDMKLK